MKSSAFVLCVGVLLCAAILAGCTSMKAPEGPVVTTTPTPPLPADMMFVTEDYPPLNYVENGTIKGISVDILRGVLREMDAPVSSDTIRVLPWSKAYETALSRNNTAVFATIRLPEREPLFKWAGPLDSERKVIFSLTENPPAIASPADLNHYTIGVVKEDSAHLQLLGLGVNASQIYAYPTAPSLISAAQEKTINLWCYGETAGRYSSRKVTGDPNYFVVVYSLESQDHYFAFNRNTSDQYVAEFQAALDTLRNQPDDTGITEYQRIIYHYLGVSCIQNPPVSREQVTGLVNFTAEEIEKDTPGTIARINAGEHPFWDRENRALYVFVYDTNVTIVAEADNPRLVGAHMKGKTDVASTPFRDQLVEKALAGGSGWVDYIWIIPGENGVYYKSAYCRLVKGSDGEAYIVSSGMYTPCKSA